MDTENQMTEYPSRSLRNSFKAMNVYDADFQQTDLLVSWPVKGGNPEISVLTEENKERAAKENSTSASGQGKERPKHRHAILRPIGDVPAEFLVAWAKVPNNAAQLKNIASDEGRFYINAKSLTDNMLTANAPAPDAEQFKSMEQFSSLMTSYEEYLGHKRKMLDTQEKMLFAITQQVLSGKINKEQAKGYIKDVLRPDMEVGKKLEGGIHLPEKKVEGGRKPAP